MLTTMTRTVDLQYLPGGAAVLLRVLASDGVNTGVDYTDGPVVVPRGKAPLAIIERPVEGEVFGDEDVVILQGNMLDPERATLARRLVRLALQQGWPHRPGRQHQHHRLANGTSPHYLARH